MQVNVQNDFEAWKKKCVAQLERELQRFTPKVEKDSAVPRDTVEEMGRALGDYLRRNRCVQGTLEFTRIVDEDGTARVDSLVYGLAEGGQLETFFDYPSERFLSLAEAFLEQRGRPGKLTLKAEVSLQRYTATLEDLSGVRRLGELDARERERVRVERRLSFLREASPDTTPYGLELAGRVVQKLQQGRALAHSHRDYCGMGLFPRDGGGFVYAAVVDGGYDPSFVERAFDSAQALLPWLAQQSDLSLSGYGKDSDFLNQRIDRQRLEAFAAQA